MDGFIIENDIVVAQVYGLKDTTTLGEGQSFVPLSQAQGLVIGSPRPPAPVDYQAVIASLLAAVQSLKDEVSSLKAAGT